MVLIGAFEKKGGEMNKCYSIIRVGARLHDAEAIEVYTSREKADERTDNLNMNCWKNGSGYLWSDRFKVKEVILDPQA
jgi:hypothetical protein